MASVTDLANALSPILAAEHAALWRYEPASKSLRLGASPLRVQLVEGGDPLEGQHGLTTGGLLLWCGGDDGPVHALPQEAAGYSTWSGKYESVRDALYAPAKGDRLAKQRDQCIREIAAAKLLAGIA